jgi:hypothetical protein
VLHPRHKLEYFKIHKWEDAWIQAAREIVQEEYSRSYESLEDTDDEDDDRHNGNKTVSITQFSFHSLG